MFTREELIEKSSLLVDESQTLIEVIEFTPDDFPSSSSEECIAICRGSQSDFESALHFWVLAQQVIGWSGREEYLAVFQPISEQDFGLRLNQIRGLKYPLFVTPKGKYIQGQRMSNEWYAFSALAEFESEYISFNWDTTA